MVIQILKSVLGKLSLSDLKQSRLVCKNWNHHALNAINDIEHCVTIQNSNTVTKFSSDMKKAGRFPYTKFCLKNAFTPRIQSHFVEHQAHIRHLRIDITKTPKTPNIVNLNNILVVLRATPYLESLNLQGVSFKIDRDLTDSAQGLVFKNLKRIRLEADPNYCYGFSEKESIEILRLFLMKFFGTIPNLESFDFAVPRYRDVMVDPFLKCLVSIPTLKHLGISNLLDKRQIGYILWSKFKLESLKIGETIRSPETFGLPLFLRAHANSLKALELEINFSTFRVHEIMKFQIPTMVNLKKLTLKCPDAIIDVQVSFGDHIEPILPCLKKVELINLGHLTMQKVFTTFSYVEDVSIKYTTRPRAFYGDESVDVNDILTGVQAAESTWNLMNTMLEAGVPKEDVQVFFEVTVQHAKPSLYNMKSKHLLIQNFEK